MTMESRRKLSCTDNLISRKKTTNFLFFSIFTLSLLFFISFVLCYQLTIIIFSIGLIVAKDLQQQFVLKMLPISKKPQKHVKIHKSCSLRPRHQWKKFSWNYPTVIFLMLIRDEDANIFFHVRAFSITLKTFFTVETNV